MQLASLPNDFNECCISANSKAPIYILYCTSQGSTKKSLDREKTMRDTYRYSAQDEITFFHGDPRTAFAEAP